MLFNRNQFWDRVVPDEPGNAPIPDGSIRLFHRTTDEDALRSIVQDGLKTSHAKGDTYGEPNAVWATAQPLKMQDQGDRPTVEFWAKPEEVDIGGPIGGPDHYDRWREHATAYGSNVTMRGDVDPRRIVGAHHSWHQAARYIEEDERTTREVVGGGHDNLVDMAPESYGRAIPYVKSRHKGRT